MRQLLSSRCFAVDVDAEMSHSRSQHPHGLKSTGLDEIWTDLQRGMDHVYQHQGMPKQRYMELYTYPFSSASHRSTAVSPQYRRLTAVPPSHRSTAVPPQYRRPTAIFVLFYYDHSVLFIGSLTATTPASFPCLLLHKAEPQASADHLYLAHKRLNSPFSPSLLSYTQQCVMNHCVVDEFFQGL